MIAKAEWFKMRKFGGWGITPKNKKGWIYIALIIIPFVIFQALPLWNTEIRIYATVLWAGFLILDIIPVMMNLKKDEREKKNEAISERNASWFMVIILTIGLVYEIINSGLNNQISINWFIVIALFGGAMIKTLTFINLDKKGE